MIEQVIDRGMIPGISPSKGMIVLAGSDGETVGSGLDGLRERLAEYAAMGVGFSKWRAAFQIGPGTRQAITPLKPTPTSWRRWPRISQEAGIVPIVEPEVMLWGDHTIEQCFAVSEWAAQPYFRGALFASRRPRGHAGQSQHGAIGK